MSKFKRKLDVSNISIDKEKFMELILITLLLCLTSCATISDKRGSNEKTIKTDDDTITELSNDDFMWKRGLRNKNRP